MFQESDFEVVVNIERLNTGPDHLSCIKIGEETTNSEEGLPDTQLFAVHVMDDHFEDIIHFITTGILCPTKEGISNVRGRFVCHFWAYIQDED